MRVLFFGDVVGKNGRNIVLSHLDEFVKKYRADVVIINGENVTHGKGLIENHYRLFIEHGVDVITLGNHYNSKNEIAEYIDGADQLVRPLNLKKQFGGVGSIVIDVNNISLRVTNLLGQVYMGEEVDSPFDCLENLLNTEEHADIHIVDFHAEATGEKYALGYAFDGKVSAVVGTHTHVQTRDNRIFPNGTGYISDIGMCGPYNGILGTKKDSVIARTWHHQKARFEIDDDDDSVISAVIMEFNDKLGTCESINTIYQIYKN